MKILIITKDTEKDWQPAIKEAKPFIKKLNGTGETTIIKVKTLDFNSPREEYTPNMWGIGQPWLRFMSAMYAKGYDMVMWHDRDFEVKGAGGWYIGQHNGILITQCFGKLGIKNHPHKKEFKLWHADTLIHELLHGKYNKRGLPDRTHRWADKDNLMGGIEDLNEIQNKWLLEKLLQIQALLQPKKGLEVCGGVCHLPLIIHHSASPKTSSVEDVRKWSNDFYNTIIRQGVVHKIHDKNHRGYEEVCVVGQFYPEYEKVKYTKPSQLTINALKKHIGKREYMGHKEAGDKGIAEPSVCPGDLLKYL